jgi:hypothetical protein
MDGSLAGLLREQHKIAPPKIPPELNLRAAGFLAATDRAWVRRRRASTNR